ncbi:RNA polymerase subunit sigma-24 [Rhodococcus rhodnii]|uniref:Sigma factor, includes region 2 n=2 Tax=Rhodococcus rhodnii TaxID=38312 RepID=R7WJM8_9NOCA|nr:DUF6596 domain-containing protein [Rhodococcus rhodnii]EOM75508.1 sigma factor, includes region 2 [Rhodococcus rhodnii LMG 5362]TXG90481.1 RNA polymerase subunit sigma-24 [Rhodococcus rhodnii]
MTAADETSIRRTVEAVWRIDGPRVTAAIARVVGDVGLAEELTQDALGDALEQWPRAGVPRTPAAWLTAVAKRKAIDGWRRRELQDDRYRAIARDLETTAEDEWEPIEDDLLKLVFAACHPALAREAQVALTLRVVTGLTSEEIARLFLVPVPTMQARITRAKRALTAARVPFEVPEPAEWEPRLRGVLAVIYLVFTEGYAATTGDALIRGELSDNAIRLGRITATLLPREAEAHALLALMELQKSRFAARVDADGNAVLLEDQDRRRWDRGQIARGLAALSRADELARARRRSRGPYALQAAIAACHARARSADDTDWDEIVTLYTALESITRNPVVTLNRAVAVSMSSGPGDALRVVDGIDDAQLKGSHLLPSVRGELLARLGRTDEARVELERAAELATNTRVRAVLVGKVTRLRV